MNDKHDFRIVNDFARDTTWLHGFFAWLAVYGIVLFVPLVLLAWWQLRAAGSLTAMARLVWTPFATLVALGIAQPIAHAVDEHRPFVSMPHVLTLVHHAADAGFPSDHATGSGAIAAAVALAAGRRVITWVTGLMALLIAFSRVYVGVHYPVDVVVGLALGIVVALALAPIAVRILEPILRALTRTPLAVLVRHDSETDGRHAVSRTDEPTDTVRYR